MRPLLALTVAAAGCDFDRANSTDAGMDAPFLDGQLTTLSHSTSTSITPAHSVACTDNATGYTRENSYYRVFNLNDFGIDSSFEVTRVDFAIESATSSSQPEQTVTVIVASLSGALVQSSLTPLATHAASIPNGVGNSVWPVVFDQSATVAPGTTLVAEVRVPDGQAAGNVFFLGANAASETAPSYLRAPLCNAPEPQTYASFGQPQVHLILSVAGRVWL